MMKEKMTCVMRKRKIRCWGQIIALNSLDEIAEARCVKCGSFYTFDFLSMFTNSNIVEGFI